MSIQLGRTYEARIISHHFRSFADKDGIEIVCSCEDGELWPIIWFTAKASGIARRQLKSCGFDIDSRALAELDQNETLLAGNIIRIEAREYPRGSGKIQLSILFPQKPAQDRIAAIQELLRAAKKSPVETASEVVMEDRSVENGDEEDDGPIGSERWGAGNSEDLPF